MKDNFDEKLNKENSTDKNTSAQGEEVDLTNQDNQNEGEVLNQETSNTEEERGEILSAKDLRSEKMRNQPISKLLFSMSLPAIISMLVQALYNIVDSMYVTRISDANNFALDAVSIAFPMCMIVNSLAIAIGVGANALIARYLGERKNQEANEVARTALLMSVCGWLIFLVLGFTISNAFITAFAGDGEGRAQIIEWGTQYLTIYLVGSLGVMVEIPVMRILQSTGNMKVPMITQIVGAVCNIVLDPIFIYDWGLNLGVAGAALATVISQWVACGVGLFTLLFRKQDITISYKNFKLQGKILVSIAKIGVPTFIMNAVMSFVTMTMYTIVGKYDSGISTMSAYFKLQSFIYMPIFGMTQGATPILAYNYGANSRARFNETVKKVTITAMIMLTVGMLAFQLMPSVLVQLFNPSAEMVAMSVKAYRMISVGFIPSALGIVCITVMQSLGKSLGSMGLSLTRTVAFVIPFAFLLDHFFGADGVWFCYPIAEVLALLIFLPIAVKITNDCFKKKQAEFDGILLNNWTFAKTSDNIE